MPAPLLRAGRASVVPGPRREGRHPSAACRSVDDLNADGAAIRGRSTGNRSNPVRPRALQEIGRVLFFTMKSPSCMLVTRIVPLSKKG